VKKNSRLTIGCDLGDRNSEICVLDEAGEVVSRQRFATTAKRFAQVLSPMAGNLVVIEVGTHSPWVSRLPASLSLEVLVANPRQVALIYRNVRKSDRTDAENLARLARVDPSLLRPIQHRSEDMQRVRITLGARTKARRVCEGGVARGGGLCGLGPHGVLPEERRYGLSSRRVRRVRPQGARAWASQQPD